MLLHLWVSVCQNVEFGTMVGSSFAEDEYVLARKAGTQAHWESNRT